MVAGGAFAPGGHLERVADDQHVETGAVDAIDRQRGAVERHRAFRRDEFRQIARRVQHETNRFALVAPLDDERLAIDMAGITHIDSTCIGRCIASLNKVTQAGGKLHMAGAAGQVRESFRVTRLDRVFRFFDDAERALAAFG